MSEETIPEGGEQPQLSPVEEQAVEAGWVPKEEFNGEEHKWVDAAEFLRRGELFKKIESQSKELKDVKRALLEMKDLHSKVREVEYKRALESLREQKKAALVDGDADAVIAVDEQIDLVKEEQRQLAQAPREEASGQDHPEFVEWTNKNKWYVDNQPMKAFADALGRDFARQGLSPVQVLKRVEEEVRKEFPNKFQNQRQNRVGAVEGTSGRTSASSSGFQLSSEERKVMQTFVRQNVMTEAEYIKELKKVKGL
jgi:hypothetical protein